jgi:anti-sigma factor RsiW
MTCSTRRETLIDLLAGELSEEETVRVEQHLAECRECRTEVNALALMTHPFLSEESWQPDAAMADRVLLRAKSAERAVSSAPRPAVPAAPSGARQVSVARPSRPMLPAWITRPLPSYAVIGVALVALVIGLMLGGGGVRLGGRGLPSEAGGSDRPPVSSPPREQPADRTPAGLASRGTAGDSSVQAASAGRRGRDSARAQSATKPIAFVAVYTDAMRLTLPGGRDSL